MSSRSKKRKKNNLPIMMIISAGTILVLAVVVIFCLNFFSSDSSEDKIDTVAVIPETSQKETTEYETEEETTEDALTETDEEIHLIITETTTEELETETETETETMDEQTTPAQAQGYLSGVTISAKNNSSIKTDLKLTILENEAVLKLNYGVNMNNFNAVRLDISSNGKSTSLSGNGVNADGTVNLNQEVICSVNDENGVSKDYRIYCKYAHELPVIHINTENNKEITSKTKYINGTFSLDANGVEGFEDIPLMGMQIRGRGCSTWIRWPKKSYKIKLNEKQSLMGKSKDKDWVLIANFHDRSLSRNNIALQLSKELDYLEYTPDSYPVDVFLNGQYLGEYDLCEQIEVAGGRVDIQKNEAAVDSGFLVEFGGDKGKYYIGNIKFIEIKYPDAYNDAQKNYILDYIKKVNKIITSGANVNELAQYVDIPSLIDWLLLMEFTYNFDAAFERNVYVYKEPGGKMKFGPAWDFDLALGSLYCWDLEYQHFALSCNYMSGVTWATYLYDNKEFMGLMKNRWLEVRDRLKNRAFKYIDEITPKLNASYEENYQRWMLPYEGKNIQWECQLEYTRRTLPQMMDYVKTIIGYRYRFLNRVLLEGYRPEKHIPGEASGGQNDSIPVIPDRDETVPATTAKTETTATTEHIQETVTETEIVVETETEVVEEIPETVEATIIETVPEVETEAEIIEAE